MLRTLALLTALAVGVLLPACVHETGLTAVPRQEVDSTPHRPRLFGGWTANKIESSHARWRETTRCQLFVYEDKDLAASSLPGELIMAELLIGKSNDGPMELAYDCQPVFATRDKLYLGPIGSYRFDYELADSALKLTLLTHDGGFLRLSFVRTADDPGRPRFPEPETDSISQLALEQLVSKLDGRTLEELQKWAITILDQSQESFDVFEPKLPLVRGLMPGQGIPAVIVWEEDSGIGRSVMLTWRRDPIYSWGLILGRNDLQPKSPSPWYEVRELKPGIFAYYIKNPR